VSRTVLAIMAGLLCALAGARHAASLKTDASRLNRWAKLLRHLALLVKEGTFSIPEALCAAADDSHTPDKLLREMAARLTASPLLTPGEDFTQCADDCQEKTVLARMFGRLGRGSKDSRVLAVEQATEEITLLAEAASARAEKDVKLWQTLGLTGGICLTILLM
jgi:stage III sporulation protein AB